MFLTASELARLTGYQPNQRARICRWLDEHGISHTENRLGEPVVLRSAIESSKSEVKINLDWLKTA